MVNNSIKEIFILLDFLFENLHCKEPNKRFWIEEGSDYVNKLVEALIKDNTAQKIIANQNLQGDSSRIQKTYTKSLLLDACIKFIFFSNTDSIKAILSNSEMQAYIYDTDFLKRNALYPFSFENLHHIICDKFFKSLYSDDSKKFWVQLEHNDTFIRDMDYTDLSDYNRGYLRLTVLSKDMLDYDRFIFDYLSEQGNQVEESNLTIFRPYFSEYYFDTKDLNQSQKKFLMNRMNHETWFNAYILPNDEQYPDDSEDIVFDGAYVYSASPVVYIGRKLVIKNSSIDRELLDKIVKTYNIPGEYCSSHVNIRDELQKKLKDVVFKNARIYNVGNGNCISLYGKNGGRSKQLLYDIGFDNNTAVREELESKPFSYSAALADIRQFTPDCVIISHWDADHYKGCAYGNDEIFNCMWVAPDIKDAGINAKRLGVYMHKIGKIKFVDRSSSHEIIDIQLSGCSKLTLYIGSRVRDLSKINCEGVAILNENEHLNKKVRCLMQGDVPYNALPDAVNFKDENPFEYLIAPHHGSQMECTLLSEPSVKKGTAIICCTNNETDIKNRPAEKHLEALNKCYKAVLPTSYAPCYIQINLNKENNIVLK